MTILLSLWLAILTGAVTFGVHYGSTQVFTASDPPHKVYNIYGSDYNDIQGDIPELFLQLQNLQGLYNKYVLIVVYTFVRKLWGYCYA